MKLSEFLNIANSKDNEQKEAAFFAVKYSRKSKARDVYGIGKLTEKTFYEVKELQRIFSTSFEASINAAIDLCGERDPNVFDFFAHYNHIRNEVEQVNEREQLLSYEPTAEEEMAGIEAFGKFGYFGQIRSIAKQYGWTLEYVKALPYSTAFTILLYDKEEADFNRRLMKIRNK